jgi:hypothetical protein
MVGELARALLASRPDAGFPSTTGEAAPLALPLPYANRVRIGGYQPVLNARHVQ